MFLVFSGFSQTGVVNNGAKMIINSGAFVKITGSGADYTNKSYGGSDGIIDLDGKIELQGDWINNASSGNVLYPLNTDGTVLFNGTSQQNIQGSLSTSFENLIINNTSGVNLSSSIFVKNVLTLSNGRVLLNASNITLGTGGSLSGSFNSSKMFVTNSTGALRKDVNSTGTFTFPIGEITGTAEYSPVTFTLTGGAFASAWIGAHVTDAIHPENSSPSEYLTRYWTLSSSGISSPVYNASFTYLESDFIGTEADIFAAEYNGATRTVYGKVNAVSNILSVSGLSSFADYTGVDGTAPTTVISTTAKDPTNSSTIPFKVTFSESVNDFVVDDIVVTNGSKSNFTTTNNPEFTFDITPTGQGEITVNVAGSVATDQAGNDNIAASEYSLVYDSMNPTVSISSSESDPTNSGFSVTITFSEEVNYFHIGDIVVGNGVASNLSTTDSTIFTANITPTTDGLVTVDINSSVAEDDAGNGNTAATQFSITFDDNPPTVAITSSESDPTNANPIQITITFNEVVSGFALSDIIVTGGTAGNLQSVTTNRIWTTDITPSGNGTITVDIGANKVQDIAGNWNTAASQFSITYDGTKPIVTVTTGESDPTKTTPFEITISFNEEVTGFDVSDINVSNGTAGTPSNTVLNKVWASNITPTAPGIVTVDIAADAAVDNAGNGNSAASQFSITFDNVDPIISGLDPADDAAGVSLNADLSINFSENIVKGTGNIIITNATTTSQHESIDVTSGQVTILNNVVTINPSIDFASLNNYYVQIPSTAFNDEAGNDYAGIADQTTWNFTAVDVNSPYIIAKSPTDNAVDVVLSSNLQITFSETVVKGTTGNITIYDYNTDTVYEQIDVTSGQVTVVSDVVTIDPGTNFVSETQYYVLIDAGAFKDTDVTPKEFPGISNSASWDFTTEDVTAPSISSTIPINNASDVAINSDLVITFDEDVAKGSGNIIITNLTTPSSSQSIDVSSGQVSISGNKATIVPNTDFDGESDYYVEMASGVFTDASSNTNPFGGISGSSTWSFTTEDVASPTVILSTAEASPTNSSPFSVTLVFNEYVDNLVVGDISVANGTPSNLLTSDHITYTVDITPSSEDTVIIIVPAGVAQDPSGNSSEESNELKLYYDITSPSVEITGPSGPIASDFDVTISFNEGITDLVSGNITVTNGSVSGVTNTTPDSVWTATITPTSDGTVTVKLLADAVVDIAGNGNSASNIFSIEYDGSGPAISTLTPTNGETNVSVSDNLVISFDDIVYQNAGTYNVEIYESGVGLAQSISTSGLSGYGTSTLTIDPADFDGQTTYYVLIDAQAFVDGLGNGFEGITSNSDWVFTTADVDPPTIVSLKPEDESVEVAVDTNLVITFNENVTKNIGSITIMDADQDLEHEVIDVASGQVSVNSNIVTIELADSLESEVNYYVLVGQSTFKDLAGNNFEGITLPTDWNFITEDLNPPVVTLKSPADNSSGVSLTTDLALTFDEKVVLNTDSITIMNSTLGSIHETIKVSSGQITASSNTITINPSIDFDENMDYYIIIPASVITDDVGNSYGGISDSETWNFTTGDFTSPKVSSLSPSDNSTDVSVTSDLVITFSEEVEKGLGSITIYNITAGSPHEVINVISGQVSITSNIVTISSLTNFDSESEYYILVDAGAFKDASGNTFAGILSTSDWTFTTADADPPILSSLSPINGATDVSINSNLVMTFNEDVEKGIGLVTIVNSTTTATHESFDISSDNVTISGNTVTINPSIDFIGTNSYYVQVASTAVKDLAGNNYAGINNSTAWNFTVADESLPYVTSYSPADNSIDVSVSSDLVLTFSEDIVANSGNITIVNESTSSNHEVIDVQSTKVTVTSNMVTINPDTDFDGETNYYVLIDNTAFKDLENNLYSGIASSSVWNFTTEDITKPIISSTIPKDDSIGVAVSSDLQLEFSEDIFKGSSGNITIIDADNSTNHEVIDITSGLVTISNNVVTVSSSDFDEFTNYYINIDNNSFVDGSGNGFVGIYDNTTWNFRTADNTAPEVISRTPLDNATDVLFNSDLTIKFDEAIEAGIGNVTIMNADADSAYETIDITSTQVTIIDSTVTINPSIDFTESTNYYVLIDNGAIRDVSGNVFSGIAGTATWNFTCIDITTPTVINRIPADEATNIALNTDLQITFSENVVANTGLITIMNSSGIHESIDVLSGQVSIVSNIVNINPSIDLSEETDYYILIDDGAFHDMAGNSYAGISDSAVWNFRTLDQTGPSIVSLSPADEATDVGVNTDLKITFDENIAVNAGYVNIMSGTAKHDSVDVTSGQVTISSNVVTINPSVDLAELTDYYVLIDNDAFTDISGNSFEGISADTVWNFTTADTTKPSVTITSDVSGTVDGAFDIVITFSEVVTGFESSDITVNNGSVTTFTETTTGQVWTATIDPVADGNVTADIAAGVAQDNSGNPNTAAAQFTILYDSGVGIDGIIPYNISIFSVGDRVIIKFYNENNYRFEHGKVEIYNLIGQKIAESVIDDFVRFEMKVDHVSHIYVVKVIIDGKAYKKRLYID